MPSGKTHLFLGFLSYFASVYVIGKLGFQLDPILLILGMVVALFYSLISDIDSETSILGKGALDLLLFATAGGLIAYFWSKDLTFLLIGGTAIVLWAILRSFVHRGNMHSIGTGVIISIPLLFVAQPLAVFALTAFMSHVLADGVVKI